mmetsp:Transcript_11347/g.27784  ORF Transcript_11347/g.27784 Transcript_11347/m.27784 type:complete len:147 (-) Transcript_11347:3-443(-)
MPRADQERFMSALLHMLVNRDGVPGTSEFARLAGYHGVPGDYCVHGTELFPIWHRVYLAEFEHALQAADRALGPDGALALPYWDWLDLDGAWPQQGVMPAILREYLPDLPAGLAAGGCGAVRDTVGAVPVVGGCTCGLPGGGRDTE